MKLYLSENHAEEESGFVHQGEFGILVANKEQVKKLSTFLNNVVKYLEKNEYCHMHFRDSFKEWNKDDFIDLAINVEQYQSSNNQQSATI